MKLLIFSYIACLIGMVSFLTIQIIKLAIQWINGEKIKIVDTYSFKWIPKLLASSILISTFLAIYIYWQTKSTEVAFTLYIFMLACIMAGIIRTAHLEYQTKRRIENKKNRV
jgi:hypothetical protein